MWVRFPFQIRSDSRTSLPALRQCRFWLVIEDGKKGGRRDREGRRVIRTHDECEMSDPETSLKRKTEVTEK